MTCSNEAQEFLVDVLLDLYKRCGKVDEQIELLQLKLKVVEEGPAFNGRKTKFTRSQGYWETLARLTCRRMTTTLQKVITGKHWPLNLIRTSNATWQSA
ncbi:protein SULFUR DEFICIENCY-INDUCED 2-like [Aristolochia californica]|uniref:protein SULFUR DEFICIENCY-INDUCED 2-like n=1 Tax=Aristolochia californica TaxID=171875 RepID=UPI0035E12911